MATEDTEPGGVRHLAARWSIAGELELRTAARLGGQPAAGDVADLVVLRDRTTGRPLLTGATLAGALRAHLTDQLDRYAEAEESPQVRALFGARRMDSDEDAQQSPLVTYDACARDTGPAIEIRDGVALDADTGIARRHGKYDLEVLPAGTCWPLRADLFVSRGADEGKLLGLLAAALGGLAPGEIALGSRRSRGLGELAVSQWRARRFDLRSPQGWCEWLLSPATDPLVPQTAHATALAAITAQSTSAVAIVPDQRRRAVITAQLQLAAPLLVRSPGMHADDPDAVHLTSAGRSLLPGTGLAGALRARTQQIARLLHSDSSADALVRDLFGWLGEQTGDAPRAGQPPRHRRATAAASRLRVAERPVESAARVRANRIRLDRVTQGVLPGGLFTEEPVIAGRVQLRLELRRPRVGELGLLLLAVRDLLDGDLPLGGSVAVGRGLMGGSATVHVDGSSVRLDSTDSSDLEWLDQQVQELVHLGATAEKP